MEAKGALFGCLRMSFGRVVGGWQWRRWPDVPCGTRKRSRIEKELDICDGILKLLDTKLIPAANAGDSKVFYLKMKGDYHRYLAEFTTSAERKEAAESTLTAYKAAQVVDGGLGCSATATDSANQVRPDGGPPIQKQQQQQRGKLPRDMCQQKQALGSTGQVQPLESVQNSKAGATAAATRNDPILGFCVGHYHVLGFFAAAYYSSSTGTGHLQQLSPVQKQLS